ncbi:MAG: hypothetical protein CFE44_25255, partial [Burkholderiales bacterium PBB4]
MADEQTPWVVDHAVQVLNVDAANRQVSHRLHMPDHMPDQDGLLAMQREAMRWTYLLRSRSRWVRDPRSRERNEDEAREALRQIGIRPPAPDQPRPLELEQLARSPMVVVRVPNRDVEPEHWEARVFPWEYVLSAATRSLRQQATDDGR